MRRFINDKGKTEKPTVWEITVGGNTIQVMRGQLGGAMQQDLEDFKPKNVGKKNEKSAEVVAQEEADRRIKKKVREGYFEVDLRTNKPLGETSASSIDFTRLPINLRFFKPQNSMNAHCQKLAEDGDALFLRKRDGMMHAVAIDDDGYPRMFSSNMLIHHKDEPGIPWMDRYPVLQAELESLELPPQTILLGEICTAAATNPKYKGDLGFAIDDFIYVGSIIKSLTPLALEKQDKNGHLGFCIWDIAFWGGECFLQEKSARKRFTLIKRILSERQLTLVTMPEILQATTDKSAFLVDSVEGGQYRQEVFEFDNPEDIPNDLAGWARNMGWEGYVVVDPDSTYGDRSYNFHGKAERPKFVCKLKPELEADFVMLWDPDNGIGEWGKGKKAGGVGAALAHLVDPKTGELIEICKVGGGLTDKLVKEFADPKLFPMVWQVGFSEWTDKGALRFPKFLRKRDDKKTTECTIDQNPAWREE